jgi:hypothetical protein
MFVDENTTSPTYLSEGSSPSF